MEYSPTTDIKYKTFQIQFIENLQLYCNDEGATGLLLYVYLINIKYIFFPSQDF